ncbi:MAG: UDP-N-acetylmuramate dehydrogenase [Candidatus Falkowbacteria bacterium]|nr:UDP-N-acetylmuramate dehydrogenase [Candidatus Falkowbacteria bacterium]
MLKIERNFELQKLNTLKLAAKAEFFAVISNREELLEAISWAKEKSKHIFVLGGGSNVLISKKIKGLVLKNEIKGTGVLSEDKESVIFSALSGESWTHFVHLAAESGWYGVENLYLVPGTAGAAPVQNIGAYGVELKDCFDHLVAIDLQTGKEKIFTSKDCKFAYRDSIFKNKLKGKYFIYSVALRLNKKANLKLDYGDIRARLKEKGIHKPNLKQVVTAIQDIRNSKLPSPALIANAGSFFKNPGISVSKFKKLEKSFPDIKSFPSGNKIKIPAGWLIEKAGFKGKIFGKVGVYEKQALILVNYGGASAKDLLNLVKKIKLVIKKQFAIDLEEEVNII